MEQGLAEATERREVHRCIGVSLKKESVAGAGVSAMRLGVVGTLGAELILI